MNYLKGIIPAIFSRLSWQNKGLQKGNVTTLTETITPHELVTWLFVFLQFTCKLLYDYPKYAIVIGPTRVTWFIQIITFDRCSGAAVQRSKVPVNITSSCFLLLSYAMLPSALGQHYITSGQNFSVLTSALVNICILLIDLIVESVYSERLVFQRSQ